MSDQAIKELAKAAGLSTEWTDFRGETRVVETETLRSILVAMDIPVASEAMIRESLARFTKELDRPPVPLITAIAGVDVHVPFANGAACWMDEEGNKSPARTESAAGKLRVTTPHDPGYYSLLIGETNQKVAVAPRRCFLVEDVSSAKIFGVATQIYSLRDRETAEFGDFAALGRLAARLAQHGAEAVAVSPTHALFAALPERHAPYSPSTRLFLNVLYADVGSASSHSQEPALIDWKIAGPTRLRQLEEAYHRFRANRAPEQADFEHFVAEGGERLLNHARFEALDARFRPEGIHHWRDWPEGLAQIGNAGSPDATSPEVEKHVYWQFLADRALREAQRRALAGGMRIGLIADLAVGMDDAGSYSWSAPQDMLRGVSIGAPPDLLGPAGQNWGLTSFSPQGLRATGFDGFLATLRASMRHAGGVRIDHAMGLLRLWVIPNGASAAEGTYLSYPFQDLLNLLALESFRQRAIVIAEDLGTVPANFRDEIAKRGLLGMRVLWFERTRRGGFRLPSNWDRNAVAMTTTHDLPTLSGWWKGVDIDWRRKIGGDVAGAAAEASQRSVDRRRLWSAFVKVGAAGGPQPALEKSADVATAGLRFTAKAKSQLALLPIEDIFALDESPNLPGTIDEHPNWRRRLPPTETIDSDAVSSRLAAVAAARNEP